MRFFIFVIVALLVHVLVGDPLVLGDPTPFEVFVYWTLLLYGLVDVYKWFKSQARDVRNVQADTHNSKARVRIWEEMIRLSDAIGHLDTLNTYTWTHTEATAENVRELIALVKNLMRKMGYNISPYAESAEGADFLECIPPDMLKIEPDEKPF